MIGLRRHDRYVLKAFWGTFAAALLFFSVIVIVLDLSERMGKLGRLWDAIEAGGRSPIMVLVEFYATLMPFMWLQLLPFCVPAAAAFCLARLIRHNELTPLLTAGVSMRRVVGPILLSGVVVVLGTFVLQETLVPRISRRHMEMWRILNRSEPDRMTRVPHFHDRGGGRLSMAVYRPFARRMEAVMITFWDVNGVPLEHHWYQELAWEDERGVWVAPAGGERIPANARDPGSQRFPVEAGAVAPIVASASLLEIAFTATRSPGLSLAQAAALADANPENPGLTLLVHQLFTTPLSILVLLLVALAFSVRIGRRTQSALPGMMGALAVAGLFLGLHFLVSSLARAGDLNPVVLAWTPNVLFGSLGVSLYLTLDG